MVGVRFYMFYYPHRHFTSHRRTFSAELDETEWPPFAVIKSSHSIAIRNLWPQWLKSGGHNCQAVMLQGKTNGLFNPLDELDV